MLDKYYLCICDYGFIKKYKILSYKKHKQSTLHVIVGLNL